MILSLFLSESEQNDDKVRCLEKVNHRDHTHQRINNLKAGIKEMSKSWAVFENLLRL